MCICHLNMHSKHASVIWTCTVNIYLSLEHARTHPSIVNYVSVTWTCTANIYVFWTCTTTHAQWTFVTWSCSTLTVTQGENRSTDQSCWTLTVIREKDRSTDQRCWTLWSEERTEVLIKAVEHCDQRREQESWSKLLNTDCNQRRE